MCFIRSAPEVILHFLITKTISYQSATDALEPGEKIENLFNKNVTQDYILQRLTDRIWFFQVQFAGTMFYVGDEGVLLIDAAEGRADAIYAVIDAELVRKR